MFNLFQIINIIEDLPSCDEKDLPIVLTLKSLLKILISALFDLLLWIIYLLLVLHSYSLSEAIPLFDLLV